jgi:predicted Fe-Mo cluster-binding NifX family protein
MRIAIPLGGEQLSPHFGHCERFALVDVDPEACKIVGRVDGDAPEALVAACLDGTLAGGQNLCDH